ncbi:MAG: putative porin [Bacteroidales bacterium]|nr:putative porin [Bacteroidales bacterium]MBQ2373305.1 putative porin [Bacteroidales bacterium]
MKNLLAKIWVPLLLVSLAALQSFGIDAGRAIGFRKISDSLSVNRLSDSTHVDSIIVDSISADTVAIDSLPADTAVVLTARDTIVVPDSLKYTDPFFYKYYIAVKDSATRAQVRDSLIQAQDTLELMMLDSLYVKDSTEVATAKFNAWYNSLTKKERKKYDYEQALPGKIAELNRKMEVKDSIKAAKDSVIAATPRILETFAIPDSMQYKRIISWNEDRYFHDVNLKELDTTYNYHFNEYPFYKEDINTTWLGVSGSPEMTYNYFKRTQTDNAIFYTPLQRYSYSPETLPNYNTKTPHTELAYWGTLFANKEKEESNIRVLTTQNILPELNLTLEFRRFGGNGILKREDTNNRNVVIASNYMGKRYLMHTGYIYNKVARSENGGIVDNFWIRDTTVDAREIDIYLKNASSTTKKNTLFLDQSYRIPFTFLENLKGRKERKRQEAVRDSIMTSGDSLAIAALLENETLDEIEETEVAVDTVNKDITTAIIGHSSEYSVFRRIYQDDISTSDDLGRQFFNDRFYLNPTRSADSLRVMKFENRFFIRLQPWKSDAIVSKLDVGIGDKLANYFTFNTADYVQGSSNTLLNSTYLYAGARGQHKKYFTWDAKGEYTFLGYEINDFGIHANLAFSAYPFRRDRKSPLTLKAHFETTLKEPDYYEQHLCTNHYMWNNDFGKISSTKIGAALEIPRWDLHASFDYALLSNNIYYDTEGIVRQNTDPMSVMTASLRKDFIVWKFHLDHQALFQLSSNKDVIPLPMLALNLRYYLQFDVVKKVMQMQIGANAAFTTKWYAPAFNPVLGVFHNQNVAEYGNCPYIDAFVNIQWKRACIFVKIVNVNMGWPNKSADYFSAAGYIAPQRAIKFGISWPFYIQPGRNNTSTGGTGASGRGGNGSGLPNGLSASR